jgi:hypothetical protein
VGAYLLQESAFWLAVAIAAASLGAPPLAARFFILKREYFWPTVLAGTVFRRRTVRVSLAYLIAVRVNNEQLLVRGERIPTQFQPVGGVFKFHADQELRKFGVRADTRFRSDAALSRDLRVLLPGKNLHPLLDWFTSRSGREIFPWREFVEELIRPGHLPAGEFSYFDCAYHGTRHLPFKFDKHSQHQQLIAAEIYELLPTPEQQGALARLYDRVKRGEVEDVIFATSEEIIRGGATDNQNARFDIPPTASWLLS